MPQCQTTKILSGLIELLLQVIAEFVLYRGASLQTPSEL